MEWITILLSSVLAAISSTGLILDRVVEKNLRDSVENVEQLAVRIDNTPSHQVLQGKVDRIRIASRGVQLIPDLRIDTLELETDPIHIDLSRLKQGGRDNIRSSLNQPLQGAIRLAIAEADINQALQSPGVKAWLEELINRLIPKSEGAAQASFTWTNAQVDLHPNNRLRLQVQLQRTNLSPETADSLDIILEIGFNLVNGRSLALTEPTGTINGRQLSTRILKGFADGLSQKLDLQNLDKQGITARLLQLKTDEEKIDLAAFIRLERLNPTNQPKEH